MEGCSTWHCNTCRIPAVPRNTCDDMKCKAWAVQSQEATWKPPLTLFSMGFPSTSTRLPRGTYVAYGTRKSMSDLKGFAHGIHT